MRQAYQLTLAGFAALAGATQLTSLSIDHLQVCLASLCTETSMILARKWLLLRILQQHSQTWLWHFLVHVKRSP